MNWQKINYLGVLMVLACLLGETIFAQEAAQGLQSAPEATSSIGIEKKEKTPQQHNFGDQENRWLFAGVGAARALDYLSTLNMRRRGKRRMIVHHVVG